MQNLLEPASPENRASKDSEEDSQRTALCPGTTRGLLLGLLP